MSSKRIYMDYNATAPMRPEALAAMREFADAVFGNPSSVHAEGREARQAVEASRHAVAQAIGARPQQLVFTSSATEANNMALKGVTLAAPAHERRLVTSTVEHPSVTASARYCSERLGATWVQVGVDAEGLLVSEQLAEALKEGPSLVSVILLNNETGVLQSVERLGQMVHDAGSILHLDATQALGRVAIDVAQWPVDLLTISSHKVGGPRGAGALWIGAGVDIDPLIHGGHQERNRRAGTENAVNLVGFAAACKVACRDLMEEDGRLRGLQQNLWDGIKAFAPDAVRHGSVTASTPQTLNVSFPGMDGATALMSLDLEGVCVSSGSACTSGSLDPSHVLLAMGISEELARSAIRFSLGYGTRPADIDRVLASLPSIIARSREVYE